MTCFESRDFFGGNARLQAFHRQVVEAGVEIESMLANQLLPAVAEALAGAAIDIENGRLVVEQEECVGRVVYKSTKARFAGAQLPLGLAQLGDVLQDAELAQGLFCLVPRHVALAVDDADGAVRTHHTILHIVTGAAGHERSRSGLADARPILGMD